MEVHPFCRCLPDHSPEKFAEIRESIIADHSDVRVTSFQGKLLDGRAKLKICESLGYPYTIDEFQGDAVAAAKFVAAQLHPRRELSKSQRAAVIHLLCQESPEYAAWVDGLKADVAKNRRSHARWLNDKRWGNGATPRVPAGKKTQVRLAKAMLAGCSDSQMALVERVSSRDPEAAQRMSRGETSAVTEYRNQRKAETPRPSIPSSRSVGAGPIVIPEGDRTEGLSEHCEVFLMAICDVRSPVRGQRREQLLRVHEHLKSLLFD